MLFPRQLESDGSVDKIRQVLAERKTLLFPEGSLELPLLVVNKSLTDALRKARLQRRVCVGMDDALEKLAAEKKGLDELRQKTASLQQERISRLLLFTNDGASRLYRKIEQTLTEHHSRTLGAMFDMDSNALGRIITGKSGGVKVILIEHKDAVSDILRALV